MMYLRVSSILFSALLSVVALQACSGDDDDNDSTSIDANSGVTVDADVNAPDADPNAPDANSNPNAPDATPSAPDAGNGGGDGVVCGDQSCNQNQECCVAGLGTTSCVATGTCDGSVAECDGAEDCAGVGEACCGGLSGSSCQAASSCNIRLCNSEDDCPDSGEVCCAFGPTASCQSLCPGQ